MTTRIFTVEVPEAVFQQLAKIADLTNQSLEAVAAHRIATNLPPGVDNAPPQMQAKLVLMQMLSVEELLEIAGSKLPFIQQQRHLELLEKNETGSITTEERQELRDLGLAADQLMLQKAYAWAVLRWRGERVPALEELPEE